MDMGPGLLGARGAVRGIVGRVWGEEKEVRGEMGMADCRGEVGSLWEGKLLKCSIISEWWLEVVEGESISQRRGAAADGRRAGCCCCRRSVEWLLSAVGRLAGCRSRGEKVWTTRFGLLKSGKSVGPV